MIASAAALLPRVSGAARLLRASVDLKPGQDVPPVDLAELLVDAGFSREDPADEHGEFAVRGGIVDIFPAGEAPPVRLEFVGDTIESLRQYDPATQRSIETLDQVAIVPLPADEQRISAALGKLGLPRSAAPIAAQIAAAAGDLSLLECNPVLIHPDGAVVVDATAKEVAT